MMKKAFGIVSREEIFRHTGLQFMQFNTLYQLLAMKLSGSPLLDVAESLLMVPDLFHWLLTGVKCNEMTEASTSQCYNPVQGGWATELLDRFSLPTRILGQIVQPGTTLGPLRANLIAETGLGAAKVVLPGLARHGQRGDGRARPQSARRVARLVLRQPWHLGIDGH